VPRGSLVERNHLDSPRIGFGIQLARLGNRIIQLAVAASPALTSELPAQQHRDWPLCGIVAIDSLAEVQAGVRIRAWREELLGGVGSRLTDSLQATLKGTVSRLTGSTDSAANARTPRSSQTGTLWLEIGVGRPRNRVTAVGGSWVLLVSGDTPISQYTTTTIEWQKTGPLHVVPVDSLIEGIRQEARRLIEEVPATLERCRRIEPSDIRRFPRLPASLLPTPYRAKRQRHGLFSLPVRRQGTYWPTSL
jgi:hypothetical protein